MTSRLSKRRHNMPAAKTLMMLEWEMAFRRGGRGEGK
jgi:hypothetical protein